MNLQRPRRRSRAPAAGLMALTLCLAVLGACAAEKPPGRRPAWLGADAPGSDGRSFYGVGCAQHEITNRFLKRDIARERARVDLAENVHDYLVGTLAADTVSARAVIVAALPEREAAGSYTDARGRFCARVKLSRRLVQDLAARQP